MRSFLVVVFASVVYARPDIGLQLQANKYQSNSGSSRQYLAPFEPHPGFSNAGHLSLAGSSGFNSGLLAPATTIAGHEAHHHHHDSHYQHNLEPLITKQFYIHSAPEDSSNFGKTKHFQLGRAQKNYRVVFIRTPYGDGHTRLSAEYAPNEDKTVIYVLSQKEHELDVNDIATPAPTTPSKPEVFFIKYKTPEEAAHAQKQIQAQYDALGGASQVIEEGTAPLTSVIGSLGEESKKPITPTKYQHESANLSSSFAPPVTTSTAYLPPNRF